jgi:hypothetical protein
MTACGGTSPNRTVGSFRKDMREDEQTELVDAIVYYLEMRDP